MNTLCELFNKTLALLSFPLGLAPSAVRVMCKLNKQHTTTNVVRLGVIDDSVDHNLAPILHLGHVH
jgi:hypothetical protein